MVGNMAAISQESRSVQKELIGSSLHRGARDRQVNFDCLEKMYDDKLLCDVVLVAEGMEVQAHKLILASCSAYFYWKFSEDRKLGQLNRIEIQNVTYDVLWAVVSYLYTAEIIITDGNVRDLLAAAHMFGLRDLRKGCFDFLKTNLNPENCVGIRNIVERYKFEELIPMVDDYVSAHFSEVIRHEEYLEWTCDQISDMVSREKLSASEEDVLGCVLQWIGRDARQRKGNVSSLLKHIKFSLISQMNILRKIEEQQWLKDDPQIKFELFKLHTLADPSTSQTRSGQSKVLVVVGEGFDRCMSIEIYDFQNKTWLEKPKKAKSVGAVHGTTIYYIDDKLRSIDITNNTSNVVLSTCGEEIKRGKSDFLVFDSVIYFAGINNDTRSMEREIANMREGRNYATFVLLDGNLYAVGGRDYKRYSLRNSVECYSAETNTWHTMPSLSVGREYPGVGALGDTLFVVGGRNEDGVCKIVESFDPAEPTWRRLPDMNVDRWRPGVIAVDGQLYVIGGWGKDLKALDSVEIYDPKSNTWSMLPSKMNVGKWFVSAALVDKSKLKL